MLTIRTGLHTNCAAHRMHSCCNPLLYDMLDLTASAVSCVEPVQSRLQAAAAEVAVANLLLLVWFVCVFMTLCWVFPLHHILRYCVGGGSTCIELWHTNKPRSPQMHLESVPCCHNPDEACQGSFVVLVAAWSCVPTPIVNRYCGWDVATSSSKGSTTKKARTSPSELFTACVSQSG